MEVTLEAGVSIDLATRDDIAQHHRWLQDRLGKPWAEYKVLSGFVAKPAGAGNPVLIDLGGPPAGLVYALQWVSVFPDVPGQGAISNVFATLYAGAFSLLGAVPNTRPDDVVMPGMVVPTAGGQSVPDAVFCRAGQKVFVTLTGSSINGSGTANQWNANVGVLVKRDEPSSYWPG